MGGGRCSPLGGGQSARPRSLRRGAKACQITWHCSPITSSFLLCFFLLFTFLQSFDPSKRFPRGPAHSAGPALFLNISSFFRCFFQLFFCTPKMMPKGSQRAPKWRPKSAQNRQKWAPGPLPMAALILDASLDRPRESLCAPNTANTISNSHRALVQKVTFWLPFGLHFGAFWGPFWLF